MVRKNKAAKPTNDNAEGTTPAADSQGEPNTGFQLTSVQDAPAQGNNEEPTVDLADAWLNEALPQASVSAGRSAPSFPVVTKVEVLEEQNQNKQINGVNLQITFAAGSPERKGRNPKPAVPELWVSRQISIDDKGTLDFPGIMVTQACGLTTRGNFGALGEAVSLRFGQHGDGDDTYFATMVPSTSALDKLMENAIKACNASPQLLQNFKDKGWIKTIKNDKGNTHIVEFPASQIGYAPFLFCHIGEDGRPVVNPFSDKWSSTRRPGDGMVFKWDKDSTGNWIAEPVVRQGQRGQDTRQFRGQVFRNPRAESVANAILKQIQLSPAWAKIQAIKSLPADQRNANSGARPNFVNMGPKAMGRPDQIPNLGNKTIVGAGNRVPRGDSVVNPDDIPF